MTIISLRSSKNCVKKPLPTKYVDDVRIEEETKIEEEEKIEEDINSFENQSTEITKSTSKLNTIDLDNMPSKVPLYI